MKVSILLFLLSFSSFAQTTNPLFDKVKWAYEVYEEGEKKLVCSNAKNMGSPSIGQHNLHEVVKTPLDHAECFTGPSTVNSKTNMLERTFYCHKKGSKKSTIVSSTISCNESQKQKESLTLIPGKIKGKGYRVKFTCML